MRCSTVATVLVAVFISCTPTAVKAEGYLETDVKPLTDKNGIVHDATILDPQLLNPWGITESTTSPLWVSDNGAGVSTLYIVSTTTPIAKNPLVVSIPTCDDPLGASGKPTGVVFNPTTGFVISNGTASAPARFLFATEDGTIVGWNPAVDPTHGIIAIPQCPITTNAAAYKGLAIATTSGGAFLYATNFQRGVVDIYDQNFHFVKSLSDPHVTAGFAPFNVAVIGSKLFVSFAVKNPATGDNVPGKGSGMVDVFDLNGTFLERFAQGGPLKVPWGMALVPSSSFGSLAGTLWIGNFGDGHINAFDPETGAFVDKVRDRSGKPIVIDGLWALQVGNGANGGLSNAVYFTAGPNDENDGLFGSLTPN
jgi:uncharacterized protein (TIGR03118 family)